MTKSDRGPSPKETLCIIKALIDRDLLDSKKFEEMHHFTKQGKKGGSLARFQSYCDTVDSFRSGSENEKLARELQRMLDGPKG
jgi:hypothetical protein